MAGVALPIETPRLVLRAPAVGDAPALHELYADPIAMADLADDLPTTVEDSAAWVRDKTDLQERTGLSLRALGLETTAPGVATRSSRSR